MFKKMVSFLVFFSLSACSIFPPIKTNSTTYLFNTTPSVNRASVSRPATLLVMMPQGSPFYNTQQIAYTTAPYQVAYFSKNNWAETPAQMLQPLIVKTLQNKHYFHAVIPSPWLGHYDYILGTQIVLLVQDFTVHPSVVHFSLRAELIQASTNRILKTQLFSTDAVAPSDTPYGGVIAANKAVAETLKKLAVMIPNLTLTK